MSKMLKQAQEMQKQIEEVQSQLSEMIIESESGGGLVSVKVNGKQEVLELIIDPEAMDEDKEMLEMLKNLTENKNTEPLPETFFTDGMIGKLAQELSEEIH